MDIDRAELEARLEEAARMRLVLRTATREWRALGERALRDRERTDGKGPERPDHGDAERR